MKIRIKGNALRFRLTRSEVEIFTSTGIVTDQINFGASTLQYKLVSSNNNTLSAAFEDNCISIFLPVPLAAGWNHSDRVGFDGLIPLPGTGEQLSLLVEKDFICMDKPTEEQPDHYPNPVNKQIV